MKRKRRKKRKGSLLLKLLLFVIIISSLFFLLTGIFPEQFFSYEPVVFPTDQANYLKGSTLNILLLGFDRSEAREGQMSLFRPDTIMVAALDFSAPNVSLATIPRDSFVKISGSDTYDKINHSYMYGYYRKAEDEDCHQGGVETVIRTVEDFLGGIPIHAYVVVDMDGAREIVDAAGGVVIDVEKEVRSNNGRGAVLVATGRQRLDGALFMQYVRSRADNLGGERGRTQRQQKALIALFDQLLSPKGLLSLPAFYRAVDNNLETSLNTLQIMALSLFGFRLDYDRIEGYVFAGEGKLSSREGRNIYFLVIDDDYRLEIIEQVFGLQVTRLDLPYLPGPVAPEPTPEEEPLLTPEPIPEEQPEPLPEPDPDHEVEPALETEPESPPDLLPQPNPEEAPPAVDDPGEDG